MKSKKIQKTPLKELPFDELVDLAATRIHSALLAEGGKGFRTELWLWMSKSIEWQKAQGSKKIRKR